MVSAINNNEHNRVSYGAVKDVVPQQVSQKLPENIQNLDGEKIKNEVINATKQSWAGSLLDSMGFNFENMTPQKFIICVLGAIGMVFGTSALMNNFIKKGGMFKAGLKIDEFTNKLMKNKKVSGLTKKVSDFTKPWQEKWRKTDLYKLFSDKRNLMQPKSKMAQPMLKGTMYEATDEITDCLEAMVKDEKGLGKLREILGATSHRDHTDRLINQVKDLGQSGNDLNKKFQLLDDFLPALKEFFGFNKSGKELSEFLATGRDENVRQAVKLGRLTHNVNLGESVKKLMILRGETAQTGLGKIFQKLSLRGVEAVSNGVTSRSKAGLALGATIYFGIMNKILNAPKKEKGKTLAQEVTSDMGGYIMMPLTAAVFYSAPSLKYWGVQTSKIIPYREKLAELTKAYRNTGSEIVKKSIHADYNALKKATFGDGKWYQKLARIPANFLATGLEAKPGSKLASLPKGIFGGAMRFIGLMLIVSPLLMKPINKLSGAIFGKTTQAKKEEAEHKAAKLAKKEAKALKKQQREALSKINMADIERKLQQNPEVVMLLQNNPEALAEIQKDPQKLVEILNHVEETKKQAQLQQNQSLQKQGAQNDFSAAKPQNEINITQQPEPSIQKPNQPQPQQQKVQGKDSYSYIPSSEPVKYSTTLSNEQMQKVNDVIAKANAVAASSMVF